jgi:hypothetical protein
MPAGDRGARYDHRVVLLLFWGAMALVCAVAVGLVALRETGTGVAACPRSRDCSQPPSPVPISNLRTWTNRTRGVALLYPTKVFAVDDQTQDTLRLRVQGPRPSGVEATVWISVQPGRGAPPNDALRTRRSDLAGSIVGLTEDEDPQTIIPVPSIGLVAGVGGSYRGTADSPQGPAQPAIAIIAAATNGRTTAVVSYVITGTDDTLQIRALRAYLNPILTSFTWKA